MFIYFIDVNGFGFDKIEVIDVGGLCIGVLVWNIDLVVYECVCCDYVVFFCVLFVGVFGQLCNQVIIVGNLFQCMCCFYFYDINQFCNKCLFGSGCVVFEGFSCQYVVVGVSEVCIVIYLSDMVVVMWLLDVVVEIIMLEGKICSIILVDFYYFLGKMLYIEIVLFFGEFIVVVMLFLLFGGKYIYCKVCDCVFYVFVLVLVAVIIQFDGSGCVVLGGVVYKFWCIEVVDVQLFQGVQVVYDMLFVSVYFIVENIFKFLLVK